MGTGRHLCCSGRRYTNAHAHRYSDRDRHGNCQSYCHCDRHSDTQPHCHSIAIANGHGETDANTQGGAIGKAAPNACAEAIEFRDPIFGGTGSRRCGGLRLA
jgi:hypothetical protein